ncbi:MAG: hypothetical protein ACK528_02170, partial [Alphaproteobacteria bacterium]
PERTGPRRHRDVPLARAHPQRRPAATAKPESGVSSAVSPNAEIRPLTGIRLEFANSVAKLHAFLGER